MIANSRSARTFLERHGAILARRHPVPRLAVDELKILDVPLSPPLPLVELTLDVTGNPPPDRGQTQAWLPVDEEGVDG